MKKTLINQVINDMIKISPGLMYNSYSDPNLLPPKIQKNIQRNSTFLDSESYVILNWYRS